VIGLSHYSESLEDYLEAIMMLGGDAVRSVDVATRLGVTKASVNKAMNTLVSLGLVTKAPYGSVSLTESGKTTSGVVLHKHLVLRRFLTEVLGVDSETANKEACGIEHNMSDATMAKFEQFIASLPYNEKKSL